MIHSNSSCYEDIRSLLNKYFNADFYIQNGQLRIISHSRWYFNDEGNFDEVSVRRKWRNFIEIAKSSGYDGLRAVADLSWLSKSLRSSFELYEHNINENIKKHPFIAMCTYNAQNLNTAEIAEVAKNHDLVIVKEMTIPR